MSESTLISEESPGEQSPGFSLLLQQLEEYGWEINFEKIDGAIEWSARKEVSYIHYPTLIPSGVDKTTCFFSPNYKDKPFYPTESEAIAYIRSIL